MAAWLSESDRQRLEARITAAEKRTAGELVVVLVACSDDYARPRAAAAAVLTLVAAAALLLAAPGLPALWVVAAEAPLGLAAWLLLGLGPVLRRLVPAAAQEAAVQEEALRQFAAHGVHRTRDASGVLLLVSRLEHRVAILADRGVDARIRDTGWQREADLVVAGIRAGRPAQALFEAVDRLGAMLAREFPRRPDDSDELPNRVIEEG